MTDPQHPDVYLAALPEDWRARTLLELRSIVLEAGPDLAEGIEYGMLAYALGERRVFHLHAQSGYVSLYVGDIAKVDPGGKLLAGLDLGKGCIRFRKSNPVAETGVAPFVEATLRRARAGLDIDC